MKGEKPEEETKDEDLDTVDDLFARGTQANTSDKPTFKRTMTDQGKFSNLVGFQTQRL